jgi:O-antigen/teichoic acid export membrane protein
MIRALLRRLKGELALSLIRTFVARGIAAVGGVLLFIVLGRLYGAEGVGVFALAQSIYLGAGILARYGMDNALMRYVGQDPTSSAVSVYLRWALTKSALLSTAAAIVIYLLRDQFALWFNAPMLSIVLPGIALAIPPFTVAFVLAGFMKGIRKPATACLLENGGVSLVATALVLLFYNLSSKGISTSGWAMAAAAWIVLGQGLWQAWKWRRSALLETYEQTLNPTAFKSSSNVFFVMSLAPFMQQTVFILIAGWYLSDADLGLFKVAERTALLISFILIVINAVLPPRFASLYRQGKMAELTSLLRGGALLGLLLASPLMVLCIGFPKWVLSYYGDEFVQAAPLLQLIAFAQGINVATGSVGFLLSMTGHESYVRNVSIACNAFALLLVYVLSPKYGVLGPLIALASLLITQNIMCLFYVRCKLGVWVLPCVKKSNDEI